MSSIKAYGKAISKVLHSPEAKETMMGFGPCNGGCGMVAHTLKALWPTGNIYGVLWDYKLLGIEHVEVTHVMLKLGHAKWYLDGDGAHTQKWFKYSRVWSAEKGVITSLDPLPDPSMYHQIIVEPDRVTALIKLLEPIDKPAEWL